MAERTMTLEIVTPDRMVVSDPEVVSVTAPGVSGYLGILANHAPLMTELRVGEIDYRRSDGTEVHLAAAQGFMEVADNKVTILTDSAERADEIDLGRAKAAVTRAEERLVHRQEEGIDALRAEAALLRAVNRLHVVERYM